MSHSQFHSIDAFILRHAWLNLWDKRMLLAESTRLLSLPPSIEWMETPERLLILGHWFERLLVKTHKSWMLYQEVFVGDAGYNTPTTTYPAKPEVNPRCREPYADSSIASYCWDQRSHPLTPKTQPERSVEVHWGQHNSRHLWWTGLMWDESKSTPTPAHCSDLLLVSTIIQLLRQ
jgi:hypothetical protein